MKIRKFENFDYDDNTWIDEISSVRFKPDFEIDLEDYIKHKWYREGVIQIELDNGQIYNCVFSHNNGIYGDIVELQRDYPDREIITQEPIGRAIKVYIETNSDDKVKSVKTFEYFD